MAEAAVHAIGTEGLEHCVTTPAESAASDQFRKMLEARKASAPKPSIADMIAAIDDEIAARESGARASLQGFFACSTGSLDTIIRLEAAAELFRLIEPKRAAVWNLIKPAAGGSRG